MLTQLLHILQAVSHFFVVVSRRLHTHESYMDLNHIHL